MKVLNKRPSAKQRILRELCKAWPQSIKLVDLMEFGGTSADRRIRQLRTDHGIGIDWYYEIIDGKQTNTTRYFLMPDPSNVDVENLCIRS